MIISSLDLFELGLEAISAHLTTDFWVMLVIHLIILKMMHTRISRRKKVLEKQKAELYVENLDLTGKLEYYKRKLSQINRSTNGKK